MGCHLPQFHGKVCPQRGLLGLLSTSASPRPHKFRPGKRRYDKAGVLQRPIGFLWQKTADNRFPCSLLAGRDHLVFHFRIKISVLIGHLPHIPPQFPCRSPRDHLYVNRQRDILHIVSAIPALRQHHRHAVGV